METSAMKSPDKPRLQILYVDKRDRSHENIERIGGRNPDGSVWTMSQKEAIEEIDGGKLDFFVHAGGKIVEVVAIPKEGPTYLRTEGDDTVRDNLLSLPKIP